MIRKCGAKLIEVPITEDSFKERREKILEGVRTGIAQALERHRRLGQSIAMWRDGKVVILEADQIPVASDGESGQPQILR